MVKIVVVDEFTPEDVAMMQALYSRSSASVTDHMTKVKQTGSGKFMASFYVGYDHKSIGDTGSTTIFIEGVSMLVAKAIQDWSLYRGAEASTRYIDMRNMGISDPIGSEASSRVLQRWLTFYESSQDRLREHFYTRYPMGANEKRDIYEKAIMARVFDTLRSFLPSGMRTNLSWHTDLRQAHDHLVLLRYHPLAEVRDVANQIHAALKEKYASSFNHKEYPDQEAYRKSTTEATTYFENPRIQPVSKSGASIARTNIDWETMWEECGEMIRSRPIKTELPRWMAEYGTITFDFLLDFGSFRDIQRHRNGICRMPLITTAYGFHEWYLQELSEDLRDEATKLIIDQIREIDEIDASLEDKQYLIPMGFLVAGRVTYGLPAILYTVELRSGALVHPTLRELAHTMHGQLEELFPGLVLHSDLSPSKWDIRRGLQDIVSKK